MNTVTIPATVATTVQGIETTVDTSTLHADSIAAIFEYGLRRWVQDNVNSLAAAHRKAAEAGETEEEFDAQAAVDDRIKQAVEGDLNRRGSGVSSETAWTRKAVRSLAKHSKPLADAIKATEAGDERNALLDRVAEKNPDAVAAEVERLKAEAERAAKAAKEAAAKVDVAI